MIIKEYSSNYMLVFCWWVWKLPKTGLVFFKFNIFLKLNVSTNCVELLYFKKKMKLKLILRNHCSMINLINQYMLFGLILSLVRAFVVHPMIHIENNIVQHNDWLFSIWFQVLRNFPYFFCYPIYFIKFSNASHIISSSQLMIFKKKSRFLLPFSSMHSWT